MKAGRTAFAGGLVWAGVTAGTFRGFLAPAWLHALLLFAALVLVPLVLDLVGSDTAAAPRAGLPICRRVLLPAAAALAVAHVLGPGPWAAWCAVPWAGVAIGGACVGLLRLGRRKSCALGPACADCGLVYFAIGGAWTVAERAGWRPLGFDPAIVELTAVHFHYAGLVLVVLAGQAVGRLPASRLARMAGWGVITGMPLVAIGITTGQLSGVRVLEAAAGAWLALSGGAVALLHLRLAACKNATPPVRVLWSVAGASLLWGMVWAALYAGRGWGAPLAAPGIPQMWLMHGTVNAFGFALPAVLGWWLEARAERRP